MMNLKEHAEEIYNEITGVNQEIEEQGKKAMTLRLEVNSFCRIDALCEIGNMSRNVAVAMLVDLGSMALLDVASKGFKDEYQEKFIGCCSKFYKGEK